MAELKIAVIGAGMSGLSAAGLLHKYGFSVTLYESESSAFVRDQGGTLDMHEDSGQFALKALGLWPSFKKHGRWEADVTKIVDKDGKVYMDDAESWLPSFSSRPEIDRKNLKSVLLENIPDGIVKWDHHVTGIESQSNGKVVVSFRSQPSVTVDLLIGADGAWSKVRNLLTDIKPSYSGITFIELRYSEVETRHSKKASLVGPGTLMVASHLRGIFAQRLGDGGIRVYIGLQKPEDWVKTSGIDFNDVESVQKAMLKEFADFSDDFTQLIPNPDELIPPRPLYMLPIDVEWKSKPNVTLLGDAAHLMTPFAGAGANLAILDGVLIANALKRHRKNPEEAIKVYEKAMRTKSREEAEESWKNCGLLFGPDSPKTFMVEMDKMIRQAYIGLAVGGLAVTTTIAAVTIGGVYFYRWWKR